MKRNMQGRTVAQITLLLGAIALLSTLFVHTAAAETPVSTTATLSPSGDPDGSGTALLTMYDGGDVCFDLTVANITTPVAAAQVHAGAAGVTGGDVIDFDVASNGLMGCVTSTDAQIDAIEAAPSNFYVNVQTTDHPSGAIRGQLTATAPAPDATELRLPLMPTGDPDANGIGGLSIDPLTGRICFDMLIVNISPVTAAHIYVGAAGTDGGVVVDLETSTNGASGCVFVAPAVAAAITADLPGHYYNIHTAAAPAGAVRSQLDGVLMCDGEPVTIDLNAGPAVFATTGDDVILGTPGADTIDALTGDDIVCGWNGNDIITGGDGDDRLLGGHGSDDLDGAAGNDILLGEDGDDTMAGGADNDLIRGGPGMDGAAGDAGDDRVLGGIGDDNLSGGVGDDFLGGFGGIDTISGGDGADIIFGGFGADVINGDDGNDTIRGLIGDDTVNGGAGDDMLFGDRGNDVINGNDGNDTIRGGNASDTLRGNNGDDNIAGGRADDDMFGGAGTDTCTGNLEFVADTADGTCENVLGVP